MFLYVHLTMQRILPALRRHSRSVFAAGAGCLLACSVSRPAAAVSPSASCLQLASSVSDDKNYQVFTASAAAGSGSTITGYTFDFGDNQTYSFTFGNGTTDRSRATVTHQYDKNGVYSAKASVQVEAGGRTADISSPDCMSSVALGVQAAAALVNTGPDVAYGVAAAAVVVAVTVHYGWSIRRSRKAN